jgi:hypothetical protein
MKSVLTLRPTLCLILFGALACGNASQAEKNKPTAPLTAGISKEVTQLESALTRAKKEPVEALLICQSLQDPQLKQECVLGIAPRLAKKDLPAAKTACTQLLSPAECFFRLAEATKDSSLCAWAAPHTIDCQLHVFSFSIADWLKKDATPEEVLENAPEHMRIAGLKITDSRAWIALWRGHLGAKSPLDRADCAAIETTQRDLCNQAGAGLFQDRLNHFRDRGADLCKGQLPPELQIHNDPGLDLILAQRRAQDLCDPTAKRPAPPKRLPGQSR